MLSLPITESAQLFKQQWIIYRLAAALFAGSWRLPPPQGAGAGAAPLPAWLRVAEALGSGAFQCVAPGGRAHAGSPLASALARHYWSTREALLSLLIAWMLLQGVLTGCHIACLFCVKVLSLNTV